MSEAEGLVRALLARGETIATCESLTGGLLGGAITAVAGSSAVYRGGLVTYATELKVVLAGVTQDIVERGVVTRECARAMAAGAQSACGSDWAVATTGVAGPGPSAGVPAGTVWVGIAGPRSLELELHLTGGRDAVRRAAVNEALVLATRTINRN